MEIYIIPFMVTVFSFGGLFLGGTIGIVTKQVLEEKMYSLYAFCGGVLAGILCLELIPETFSEQPPIGPVLGVGIGFLFMMLIHTLFHGNKVRDENQQALQAFGFLSLAICIHNIPTGIAIGSALTSNNEVSSSLLLAIIFHHIPEGLSLMVPFLFTQSKLAPFLVMIFLLSVVLGAGTMLGGFVQNEVKHLESVIMGSAIGMLGYIAISEMLWKAKQNMTLFSFSIFASAGLVIVKIFEFLMHH
ncbi:ZIP family metal transporter [Ectobacillus polymachus]|uniref:ZIP family metal transporter n=1 Tax=Ectobacillus polymachus TaxID=1508806 RepID=UPI003A881CB4